MKATLLGLAILGVIVMFLTVFVAFLPYSIGLLVIILAHLVGVNVMGYLNERR